MAPAAVEVHHPNRRFMVRRRSGHAITPAVVYDARLATPRPGSARANGWRRRCNRLSARVALFTMAPWSRKDGDAVSHLAANPGRSPTAP